jgi:tetratricopeptide (TPR) repeat protein
MELGEIAIRQHDYASAVDLLHQAVDHNPADALALADLAVAERLSGNLTAAAASSSKATQQMPLLPYALAENWQDTNAARTWTQTIGSDPQNYLAVAAWYHDLGAWQSSDAVLNAAIAALPAQTLSPLVYYYLADNSRQEGDIERATRIATKAASLPIAEVFPNTITDAAILTEAVHQSSQDAHARYALGNFLFAHSRYDEAAALWSEALDQKFENSVLLRNLGVYEWHVKDNLAGAAQYYARAIALSPKDYRLYEDLDEIYEEAGDTAARTTLFHGAPADVLDRDTIRARHALLFLEQLQPDQALALLTDHTFKPWEGGVVVHNIFVRSNIEKGKMALAAHKAQEAARDFREAMRYPENLGTGEPAQPEVAEQLYWLGVAFDAMGKGPEAKAAWTRAVAIEDEGKINVFSALSYGKLGQNTLAQRLLEQCIAGAENPNATANDYLRAGIAERYTGNTERARHDFQLALKTDRLFWQARVAEADMNSEKAA